MCSDASVCAQLTEGRANEVTQILLPGAVLDGVQDPRWVFRELEPSISSVALCAGKLVKHRLVHSAVYAGSLHCSCLAARLQVECFTGAAAEVSTTHVARQLCQHGLLLSVAGMPVLTHRPVASFQYTADQGSQQAYTAERRSRSRTPVLSSQQL